MACKYIRGILLITLSLALCTPGEAQSPSDKIGASNGTIAGVIAGVAAGLVVVAIVAVHYSKKRSITGCVVAAGNGMTITDEKDKQVYALSGDFAGIKPGDRMKVKGKKAKHMGSGTASVWEATGVGKDLGVCQQ